MKSFQDWRFHSDFLICESLLVEDQEFSMARGELTIIKNAISRLMKKLNGEGELEAWVQSKITKAADYITTVADYMESGEVEESYILEQSCNKTGKDKNCPVHGMKDCSVKEEKDPKGPVKSYKSPKEIAKKHGVTVDSILRQLEKGIKVEGEHTTDKHDARITALQHLDEIPDYYSRLKKIEKVKEDWSQKYKKSINCDNPKGFSQRAHCQGRKKRIGENKEIFDTNGNLFARVVDIIKESDYKFKSFTQPITEDAVEELESGLKKLENTSYDSIDKLMRRIMKEHGMTAKELHNAFVSKHDKTPDDWIKDLNEKCWDGYKRKRGTKKFSPGSCVKEDSIDEANKSGDSSLRDWFTKSRASDGTPGWVQLGGKYAGQACAKQPGQTTKPKCGSSKMKAELSDKEEESAFRRKNQEDPNPDRKGKAKMVATEEKDACYSKVKSRYKVWPSAYASGALVKCRKVGAANWGNKTKKDVKEAYLRIQERGSTYSIMLNWRGRVINTQMFFAKFTRPTKNEVTFEVRKVYPGAIVLYFSPSQNDPTKPLLFAGEPNGSQQNTTR